MPRLFLTYKTPNLIQLPREMRLALIGSAFAIAAGTVIALSFQLTFIATLAKPHFVGLTALFFKTQDAFWLDLIAILLAGLAIIPLPLKNSSRITFISRRPRAILIGLTICVILMGVTGTYAVFDGHHLSRDEFLAEFDALIFRAGRTIAPMDASWRPFASALQPRFMLPIPHDAGFVSGYLPVNAGFRALAGLLGDDNLTSPLLAACAVIATFGIARRLWPERPDAAIVSTLLVVTSSQFLVTSMTSYAMTAHLALNMVWLWFFLRDDRAGHSAAIATGFLAAGLHQLIFHPLFAVPFIVRLWLSRRRSLALVYIMSYAIICLFWVSYWKIILILQGISPEASDSAGPLYFVLRATVLLLDFQWLGADLMLKNILRFVSWNNPALLPLAILAYSAIRKCSVIAPELIAGILLTLIVMFILLPYQGHGWGYRYLHGLIGSAALLGGYGWIEMTNRWNESEAAACRSILAICSAVALFVLLPAHARQAHDFVAPYVRAANLIRQAPTDVVIVDESRLFFAEDLVQNDPFLRDLPKVLDLTNLTQPGIEYLCEHDSISLFGHDQAVALGIRPSDQATKSDDDARAKLREALAKLACGTFLPAQLK